MRQSVENLFIQYLLRSNLQESSIAIKSRSVRYFQELFGEMDVEKINYGHAEDYRSWLSKTRKTGSVNTYIKNIRPFFGWMKKRGYIEVDPFEELRELKECRPRREPYTGDEIERMMMVADLRWKVIILLGLFSLRRSEVLNLLCRDIKFDKNYVWIQPKPDSDKTWEWTIKNHNEAITPLPKIVNLPDMQIDLHGLIYDLIDDVGPKQPYLCLRPEHYQANMILKRAGELGWERRNCPWPNFSRSFRSLLRRAQVHPRRFHDLRGTFATRMIEAGRNVKETQRLMRHRSPNTTLEYYVHVDDQKLVAESNKTLEKCYGS